MDTVDESTRGPKSMGMIEVFDAVWLYNHPPVLDHAARDIAQGPGVTICGSGSRTAGRGIRDLSINLRDGRVEAGETGQINSRTDLPATPALIDRGAAALIHR